MKVLTPDEFEEVNLVGLQSILRGWMLSTTCLLVSFNNDARISRFILGYLFKPSSWSIEASVYGSVWPSGSVWASDAVWGSIEAWLLVQSEHLIQHEHLVQFEHMPYVGLICFDYCNIPYLFLISLFYLFLISFIYLFLGLVAIH